MNGMDKVLVDTNIFIYLFEGNRSAAEVLVNKELYYSFITTIELLGNSKVNKKIEDVIEEFLAHHNKFTYNMAIEKRAIQLRKTSNIKTPDAIIAATAIE